MSVSHITHACAVGVRKIVAALLMLITAVVSLFGVGSTSAWASTGSEAAVQIDPATLTDTSDHISETSETPGQGVIDSLSHALTSLLHPTPAYGVSPQQGRFPGATFGDFQVDVFDVAGPGSSLGPIPTGTDVYGTNALKYKYRIINAPPGYQYLIGSEGIAYCGPSYYHDGAHNNYLAPGTGLYTFKLQDVPGGEGIDGGYYSLIAHPQDNPGIGLAPAGPGRPNKAGTTGTIGSTDSHVQFLIIPNLVAKLGKMTLRKVPPPHDYIANNNGYSLEGARYHISGPGTELDVTTDANGFVGGIDLVPGDYRIREISASRGFKINPNEYVAHVNAAATTDVVLDGIYVEPDQNDPGSLVIQKSLECSDTAGQLCGNISTLAGAEFRVNYYKNIDGNTSGQPAASAVWVTDKDGYISFDNQLSSPEWPYKNSVGGNKFPIGTYTIIEQKPIAYTDVFSPKGAKFRVMPNPGSETATIVKDENFNNSVRMNENTNLGVVGPQISKRGKLTIIKTDNGTQRSEPQGSADLKDTTFDVFNASANPVDYKGRKNIKPGEKIDTISTKLVNGQYIAEIDGLMQKASYRVVETGTHGTYNLVPWEQTVELLSDQATLGMPGKGAPANKVKTGGLSIIKADYDWDESSPQGNATLAGAEYEIINRSGHKVQIGGAGGKEYAPGDVVKTIRTELKNSGPYKGEYVAETGPNDLPYGEYQVREIKAPTGYNLTQFDQTIAVHPTQDGQMFPARDGNKKNPLGWSKDRVMRGGVSVIKADKESNKSQPQGDATLAGVEYTIVNKSAHAVYVDGKTYQPNQTVKVIKTVYEGGKYIAKTDNNTLPFGRYTITETKPAVGYLLKPAWSQEFTVDSQGDMTNYTQESEPGGSSPKTHMWNVNDVIRGGVEVGKLDRETQTYKSLGDAHLEGAVMQIINRSTPAEGGNGTGAVKVQGKWYNPGDVVYTGTVEKHGDKYTMLTPADLLPYGTYEVKEIKSGLRYLFDDQSKKWSQTFQIREQGVIVQLTSVDKAVSNQVYRMGFHFQKKAEDTMERMDHIPFLLTSKTTGEQHVIVTDDNGSFGTEYQPHTVNTNSNDPTAPNTNGAIVVDEQGNWVVKDASKLDPDAGVYFAGRGPSEVKWSKDSTSYQVSGSPIWTEVDDEKMALVSDVYTLRELRAPNNEGYNLLQTTVTIHKNNADIDYGTLDDRPVYIDTLLMNNGSKMVLRDKNQSLIDTIQYENLSKKTTYKIRGQLHYVDAKGNDQGVISEINTEYTTEDTRGQIDVPFSGLDLSSYDGGRIVAFEYISDEFGNEIVRHDDIDDDDQSVWIPSLTSVLHGDIEHEANGSKDPVTLTDTVTYKGLQPGLKYTMVGTLMDKETKKPVVDAEGKEIGNRVEFTPEGMEGSIDVTFTAPKDVLNGKTVVAFERAELNGKLIAAHEDINDAEQTVTFPWIGTKATDKRTGGNYSHATPETTLVDHVSLKNVIVGKKYTVRGTLHLRDADGNDLGEFHTKDGQPLVVEKEVTATERNMTVDLEFTFDATELEGKTTVFFEELKRDGVLVGVHADINDEGQTIHFPKIGTMLTNEHNGHYVQVPRVTKDSTEDVTTEVNGDKVESTTEFEDKVTSDKETASDDTSATVVSGSTVRAVTGGERSETTVRDANTAAAPTRPTGGANAESEGSVSTAHGTDNGSTVVIEESADPNSVSETDTDRAVDITALDEMTPETVVSTDGTVTLVDRVSYTNFKPGDHYTMHGVLHLRDANDKGEPVDAGELKSDGDKVVEASTSFTAETADGVVAVVFTFNASDLAGKAVVAYERATWDDAPSGDKPVIAHHEDITDEGQTVRIVDMGTTAVDKHTGTHTMSDSDTVTIDDTVEYSGLKPGTEYTVTGELHIQQVDENGDITDGGVLTDVEGNPVTASANFTPDTSDGTTVVTFTFTTEPGVLNGHSVVAFETIKEGDIIVAVHTDITDKGQTVTRIKMGTTLTGENGVKEVEAGSSVKLTDTVSFEGLTVGDTYTVTGTLVKADGTPLTDSKGKPVTASGEFVAEQSTGVTDMEFTVDTSMMADGDKIVAFEQMYSANGTLVAHHEDVNDEGQTVTVRRPDTPTTHVDLQTGIGTVALIVAIVLIIAAAGSTAYYVKKRRAGDADE